jgi:hypothetical protein
MDFLQILLFANCRSICLFLQMKKASSFLYVYICTITKSTFFLPDFSSSYSVLSVCLPEFGFQVSVQSQALTRQALHCVRTVLVAHAAEKSM